MNVRALGILLSLSLVLCGCSGSSAVFPVHAETVPPPQESLPLVNYLAEKLPSDLQSQMRSDQAQVLAHYPPQVSTLSTSQYGTRLLEAKGSHRQSPIGPKFGDRWGVDRRVRRLGRGAKRDAGPRRPSHLHLER